MKPVSPVLAMILAASALFGLDRLPAYAADTACPAHYLAGKAPDLPPADVGSLEICNQAFANAVSPWSYGPAYAAEHLTVAGLIAANHLDRVDAFHADAKVPIEFRAEMNDYKGAPYDRGHMAPAGDMPTASAQRESFALSNMVPQIPNNNRGVWSRIEERVRREVVLRIGGEGWIVTGPAYSGLTTKLKGRVAVPARLWKAVYIPGDPSTNAPTLAGAYVVDNAEDATPEIISIDALTAKFGIDPMPGLAPDLRKLANLPMGGGQR